MRLLRSRGPIGGLIIAASLVVILISYARPITASVVPRDLFGLRIDRGSIQLLHGTRTALARNASGMPIGTQAAGWDAIDPVLRESDFVSAAVRDFSARPVEVEAWPPFQRPAMLDVQTTQATIVQQADGSTRVAQLRYGRTLRLRGTSLWPVVGVVVPAYGVSMWVARRRRRLQSPFACPACSYDLRASPDRCPECGHDARPILS